MAATSDHGHVPVLLDRCVELLKPALTRHSPTVRAPCSSTPHSARAAMPNDFSPNCPDCD